MNKSNHPESHLDLAKVAHLARIGVGAAELEKLQQNIDQTMTLINHMQTVDTEQITPMAHPLDMNQATRQDQAEPCVQTELQQSAPTNSTNHGLYIVPQVIE